MKTQLDEFTVYKKASIERITDMAIPHLKKAELIGEEVDEETYEWIKIWSIL